jgi:hypothetical protein
MYEACVFTLWSLYLGAGVPVCLVLSEKRLEHDLAAEYAEKVKELQALFREEAEKYQVTPLMGGAELLLRRRAPADEVHLLR